MIGAEAVPARLNTRSCVYVPALTNARCPGCSVLSAFCTVRQGAESEPEFESEPLVAT